MNTIKSSYDQQWFHINNNSRRLLRRWEKSYAYSSIPYNSWYGIYIHVVYKFCCIYESMCKQSDEGYVFADKIWA